MMDPTTIVMALRSPNLGCSLTAPSSAATSASFPLESTSLAPMTDADALPVQENQLREILLVKRPPSVGERNRGPIVARTGAAMPNSKATASFSSLKGETGAKGNQNQKRSNDWQKEKLVERRACGTTNVKCSV